jgi:hypothetical protein
MMPGAEPEVDTVSVRIPMRFERRGGRKLIIAPDGGTPALAKTNRDETMIRALVKAHRWRRQIEISKASSITDLAAQEGVTDAYVCRILPLTCLAPDVVQAILDGRHPKGLKLSAILRDIPVSWVEQRRYWIWPS